MNKTKQTLTKLRKIMSVASGKKAVINCRWLINLHVGPLVREKAGYAKNSGLASAVFSQTVSLFTTPHFFFIYIFIFVCFPKSFLFSSLMENRPRTYITKLCIVYIISKIVIPYINYHCYYNRSVASNMAYILLLQARNAKHLGWFFGEASCTIV